MRHRLPPGGAARAAQGTPRARARARAPRALFRALVVCARLYFQSLCVVGYDKLYR